MDYLMPSAAGDSALFKQWLPFISFMASTPRAAQWHLVALRRSAAAGPVRRMQHADERCWQLLLLAAGPVQVKKEPLYDGTFYFCHFSSA